MERCETVVEEVWRVWPWPPPPGYRSAWRAMEGEEEEEEEEEEVKQLRRGAEGSRSVALAPCLCVCAVCPMKSFAC